HSPEVECISKGKSHKRYEFGCKVSLVTTSKSNWVVGVQALHDNPYDGHTLKDAINQMEKIVGLRPKEVYALNPFLKLKHLTLHHNQPHKLNRILESKLNSASRFRLKNTHFSSVPTRMSLFTCKKYVFLIEKSLPNFST
ncbi:hypothetical protein LEP1GSC072_0694, partial [Leptospira noguchii str. Bonito]